MKKYLYLLLFLVMITSVQALEFDNVKSYNTTTKTATIKNSFLGIPTTTVAEITLDTPQIYHVVAGKDRKVAQFTINNYEEGYPEAIKNLELYNNYNNRTINRDVTYKYQVLEGYQTVNITYTECVLNKNNITVCSNKNNGTKQEPVYSWNVLNEKTSLPQGKITIGIFTDVIAGDNVEWIPTLFGKRIPEWATWTDSFNNQLMSYYKLDETTGGVLDSMKNGTNGTNNGATRGATGKISNAYDFESSSGNNLTFTSPRWAFAGAQFTINAWVKAESLGNNDVVVGGVSPNSYFFGVLNAAGGLYFGRYGAASCNSAGAIGVGGWNMISIVYNSSGATFFINGSRVDTVACSETFTIMNYYIGSYATNDGLFDGIIDEISFWNRSLTNDEMSNLYNSGTGITFTDNLPPVITNNAPANNTYTNNNQVTFNATVYDTQTAIANVTLWLDGVANTTNTSGVNGTNYIFTKTLSDANHTWFVNACDVEGLCDNSTRRTVVVDTTAPTINNTPVNTTFNYIFYGHNLTINPSYYDLYRNSCWYSLNNGTNTSISCTTPFNISITTFNNTLTVYANDTAGNVGRNTTKYNYDYIVNSLTYNGQSYELAEESFILNMSTPTTKTITSTLFVYNGTTYTVSNTTNTTNHVINRTISLPAISATNNFYFNITFNDSKTFRLNDTTQTITPSTFTICNTTVNVTYLRITFKDEGNQSTISAVNDLTDIDYYMGTGASSNSYTYSNSTANQSYSFCFTPPTLPINLNMTFKYSNTNYPLRTFIITNNQYTNSTTNQTLYLLASDQGIYTTFQVLNAAEEPLSGVTVNVTRQIGGTTTVIGTAISDDAGLVTFWVNPNFDHTFTFSRVGYDLFTYTTTPTQSSYTVILGVTAGTTTNYRRGVSYVITPARTFLNENTNYNFSMAISSSYYDLEEYGYNITYLNGSVIIINNGTSNRGGTLTSNNINVSEDTKIFLRPYYIINGNRTIILPTVWTTQSITGAGYSIKRLFEDLDTYLTAGLWGFDSFGKTLLSVLLIIVITGTLSSRYGLGSEAGITGILFSVVFLLEIGLEFIPDITIPQTGTTIPRGTLTAVTLFILLITILKEETG